MKIFQSEESDNSDLCLKMGCVEYFRNFFNDGEFRVNAFQHLVSPVVEMARNMLLKCSDNPEAINEILELYRWIVEKYAGMVIPMEQGVTLIDFMVGMMT